MPDDFKPSTALHSRPPPAASPQGLMDRLEIAGIALDRTRMPMAITDPRQSDNPIVLANQAFLDLTGYGAEEVIGRNCRFLQGEGTSPAVLAELRAAIAEPREITIELLNYRKDGRPFWNQLHISPIHDDDGKLLYFFASQDDVTEYRKVQSLQATEHRLLKEVDHRARNVLAVVNGIVRLSRSENPAHYAASIQQRVQALASAHTLLADRGWQAVSLEQIIKQQLDLMMSDRIRIFGPEIMVPASVVQPLALVIHELLVNATIHGVLAGPEGRLDVSWTAFPAYGGFKLLWEEAGSARHGETKPPGFGAAMTRGMIEKQLRGEVRRDWHDKGVTITLTIPGGSEDRPDPPRG